MASSVELASLAGTWVASGLAIIALVGIIGPLYALRAASSARNRALNGVWDRRGRYVHGGIPVSEGVRILRRCRVPNLAHNYRKNDARISGILSGDDRPAEYGLLGPIPDALLWNTGWTRLCALIQSHYKSPEDNEGMCSRTTNGQLEFIDSHAALAVSRYWILFLGLLGVYGWEAGHPSNQLPQIPNVAFEEEEPDEQSDESGNTRRSPTNALAELRTYCSRHGCQIFSSSPSPVIQGSTGRFKSLGRQKYSIGIRDIVSFQYEGLSENQLVQQGSTHSRTVIHSTLQTRFWLAFGSVPGRNREALSFLIASPLDDNLASSLSGSGRERRGMPYLRLQESLQVPVLLQQCLKALRLDHGEDKWKALQWKSVPDSEIEGDIWLELRYDRKQSSWIQAGQYGHGARLRAHDVAKCLDAMFQMEWDVGGFLIFKSSCDIWMEILRRATHSWYDLDTEKMRDFVMRLQPDLKTHIGAFDWRITGRVLGSIPYIKSRTQDLVQFENQIDGWISRDLNDLKWVKYLVATAFVVEDSFRDDAWDIIERYYPSAMIDHCAILGYEMLQILLEEPPSTFNYDARTGVLAWLKANQEEVKITIPGFESYSWMSPHRIISIPTEDIGLISIWAATRCMIWYYSRDSGPLVEFVNGLDRNVLVI